MIKMIAINKVTKEVIKVISLLGETFVGNDGKIYETSKYKIEE